jgi:hypothetical protein
MLVGDLEEACARVCAAAARLEQSGPGGPEERERAAARHAAREAEALGALAAGLLERRARAVGWLGAARAARAARAAHGVLREAARALALPGLPLALVQLLGALAAGARCLDADGLAALLAALRASVRPAAPRALKAAACTAAVAAAQAPAARAAADAAAGGAARILCAMLDDVGAAHTPLPARGSPDRAARRAA